MTEAPHTSRKWLKRLAVIILGMALLLCLTLIAARLIMRTSWGHNFAETQIEAMAPAGHSIEIDGLRGDLFERFEIKSVTVLDAQGVWMSAKDIDMRWSPLSLLGKNVVIDALTVSSTHIIRKPILAAADEPLDLPFKSYSLGSLSLPSVSLSKALIGQDVTLTARGRASHSEGGGQLTLDARTLNTDIRDSADIDLTWSPQFLLAGNAKIIAEPNGLMAGLLKLGTPDTLRVDVKTSGTQNDLTTTLNGRLGELSFITGEIKKIGDSANVRAKVSPQILPKSESFDNLLGGDVSLTASIDNLGRKAEIDARITAPKLDVDVTAIRSTKGYAFPKLIVTARSPLSSFTEMPASLDTVSITGSGSYDSRIAFEGRVIASGLKYNDYAVKSISGPLSLTLSGTVLNFDTELTGEAAQDGPLLKWMGSKPKLLAKGRYDFSEKSLSLSQSDVRLPGLNAAAAGQASLMANTADFKGRFDIQKDGLIPALPANISGKFSAQTIGGNIAVDVQGKARDVGSLPAPLPQIIGDEIAFNAKTSFENGRGIRLRKVTVTAKDVSLSGSGYYNFDQTLKASLDFAVGPFEVSAAQVSSMNGNAKILGALGALDFDIVSDIQSLTAANQTFTQINFNADGRQENSSISANIKASAESYSGPVSIASKAVYAQGQWQLSEAQVNLGDMFVKGDLAGDGADLSKLSGAVSVIGNPLPFLPAKSVNLDVHLSGKRVDVGGIIKGINSGPLKGVTLSLAAQGPQNAVVFEANLEGDSVIAEITRNFALSATGSADLRFPRAAMTTDITGNIGRIKLTTAQPVTLSQTETGLRGSGALGLFDGTVSFRLGGQPQSLTLTGDNLKSADIMMLMGRAVIEGRTEFNAKLQEAGPGFDADFAAKLMGVRRPGSDAAVLDAAITGQILNNQLTLKAQSPSGALSGQARLGGTIQTLLRPPFLNWPPAAPLRGTAKAAGDIGPFAELFLPPETDFSGDLNMDIQYSLPLEARGMNGTLSMTGGAFEQGAIGLTLKDIDFAANLAGTKISVSRFSARDNKGGTLTGDGQMDIGFVNGSAINLSANTLHLLNRREGFAVLSGDLKLSHEENKLALKGDLVVDDASVSIDKFPRAGRPTLEVNFGAEGEKSEKPVRTATELDVKITSPSRIKLTGRGVNASMALGTHITGAFNDPVLSGDAKITRGRFDFLGKRFELDDSKIVFNDVIMNSRLDVAAIRETSDLTATVAVTGTLSRPEIALESTPQLPEDEVISRILFGRSATQLTTIETARLAAALAQLSGGGGFDLFGGLENALGLDTLDFGQSDSGQAQVTTGKYLSDNVYVEVRGAAEGTPSVAVEWTPRKNIAIEAETAPGETQRVSVQWQKDFD